MKTMKIKMYVETQICEQESVRQKLQIEDKCKYLEMKWWVKHTSVATLDSTTTSEGVAGEWQGLYTQSTHMNGNDKNSEWMNEEHVKGSKKDRLIKGIFAIEWMVYICGLC